jgi:hypothetical protein
LGVGINRRQRAVSGDQWAVNGGQEAVGGGQVIASVEVIAEYIATLGE